MVDFRIVRTFVLSILLIACSAAEAGVDFTPRPMSDYGLTEPGQLVVLFKPDRVSPLLEKREADVVRLGLRSFDQLAEQHRLFRMSKVFPTSKPVAGDADAIDLSRWYLLEFSREADLESALLLFGRDENVEYAEPVMWYPFEASPNDPGATLQYWLADGTHGMKVRAAWDTSTGDSTVIVAIIDSGVNYNHPRPASEYLG